MKPAFVVATDWNSAVCSSASSTSCLAESIVPSPMERIDTLGVAGSKAGRVMTAVRVMTARVEDMMCPGRGTSVRTSVLQQPCTRGGPSISVSVQGCEVSGTRVRWVEVMAGKDEGELRRCV